MRAIALVAVVCLSLTGCSTLAAFFGPRATQLEVGALIDPAVDTSAIAADAVKQLQRLYSPAKSRFSVSQPVSDSFGQALLSGLRKSGYAIWERPQESSSADASTPSDGLPLSYLVDGALGTPLVLVRITAGRQALTRAYIQSSGSPARLDAAGRWVRKE